MYSLCSIIFYRSVLYILLFSIILLLIIKLPTSSSNVHYCNEYISNYVTVYFILYSGLFNRCIGLLNRLQLCSSVACTLYISIVHCTSALYTVQCTLYIVHQHCTSALYTVHQHCTLYISIVHCTNHW